ncbi:MAG: 30S ribosomal protein S16 [Chloroflexi bacterium]|nr:MAG: 30S ribosomal protein S16 [Chloroflexota bacterium]
MLRIRLTRTGKKGQPSYRIVVTEITAKRDGRIVERIGHYNPLTEPSEYLIQEERALYWLSKGAQPTDAVERLLVKQGTRDRLKRLHAGESLEALVAEYEGVDLAAVAAAEVAVEATEAVAEEE